MGLRFPEIIPSYPQRSSKRRNFVEESRIIYKPDAPPVAESIVTKYRRDIFINNNTADYFRTKL